MPQGQRATYLSLQSLPGRLAFSAALLLLSLAAGNSDAVTWPTLAWMLRAAGLLDLAGLMALVVSRRALGGVAPQR